MQCELNQIFIGEIASVQNYGAFVRIPGCRQQGLIHKTQISSGLVENVFDILQLGDKVWCKVISLKDDGKIGLSMKFVNQGTGADLDPNNVKLQLEEQRRKTIIPGKKTVIKLDAVFNTICTKCKTPGHLASDCFSIPGGKTYELLSDEVETSSSNLHVDAQLQSHQSEIRDKKSKKSKKRKKSKLEKHEELRSDESDSEKTNKKKKKSKDKKHKKKKHHSSLSDSSDHHVPKKKKYK